MRVQALDRYASVCLGLPNWGGATTAPADRAFRSAHDLAGKTLVPFTASVIARL